MNEFLSWWPVITVAGGGIITCIGLYFRSQSHTSNIKKLWDFKADEKEFVALKTKVDGMDAWTRKHEEDANAYRLKITERFAAVEQSMKLSTANHEELIRMVKRVEEWVEKMEHKFEVLVGRVETALRGKQ